MNRISDDSDIHLWYDYVKLIQWMVTLLLLSLFVVLYVKVCRNCSEKLLLSMGVFNFRYFLSGFISILSRDFPEGVVVLDIDLEQAIKPAQLLFWNYLATSKTSNKNFAFLFGKFNPWSADSYCRFFLFPELTFKIFHNFNSGNISLWMFMGKLDQKLRPIVRCTKNLAHSGH